MLVGGAACGGSAVGWSGLARAGWGAGWWSCRSRVRQGEGGCVASEEAGSIWHHLCTPENESPFLMNLKTAVSVFPESLYTYVEHYSHHLERSHENQIWLVNIPGTR